VADSDRIKWDERYSGEPGLIAHPTWIGEFDDEIPRSGFGLDIATGSGRLAIWLAGRGLSVTAVDISPVGLQLARRLADHRGLHIETVVSDLELGHLPENDFQVITCFRYWQTDLFPVMFERLSPGGILIAEVATKPNLEKHDHPSARYLAEPESLRAICSPLDLIYYQEAWFGDEASARIVARKR
jgi:tellurite methyltransferase